MYYLSECTVCTFCYYFILFVISNFSGRFFHEFVLASNFLNVFSGFFFCSFLFLSFTSFIEINRRIYCWIYCILCTWYLFIVFFDSVQRQTKPFSILFCLFFTGYPIFPIFNMYTISKDHSFQLFCCISYFPLYFWFCLSIVTKTEYCTERNLLDLYKHLSMRISIYVFGYQFWSIKILNLLLYLSRTRMYVYLRLNSIIVHFEKKTKLFRRMKGTNINENSN